MFDVAKLKFPVKLVKKPFDRITFTSSLTIVHNLSNNEYQASILFLVE